MNDQWLCCSISTLALSPHHNFYLLEQPNNQGCSPFQVNLQHHSLKTKKTEVIKNEFLTLSSLVTSWGIICRRLLMWSPHMSTWNYLTVIQTATTSMRNDTVQSCASNAQHKDWDNKHQKWPKIQLAQKLWCFRGQEKNPHLPASLCGFTKYRMLACQKEIWVFFCVIPPTCSWEGWSSA